MGLDASPLASGAAGGHSTLHASLGGIPGLNALAVTAKAAGPIAVLENGADHSGSSSVGRDPSRVYLTVAPFVAHDIDMT